MTNRPRQTFAWWTGSLPLLGALPETVMTQAGEQPAASGVQPAGNARPPRSAYVGTYTLNAPGGTAGGPAARGIYVLVPRGDAWTQVQVVESANPSSLVVYPNQRFLYAINELEVYEGCPSGSAESYAIDPRDGKLMLLNRQPLPLPGINPVYVVASPNGKYPCVLIYSGGVYNPLPIGEDGKLGTMSGIFGDTGSGPRSEQETPYAHAMLLETTGQHVTGTDLGVDRINVLIIEGGKLAPQDRAQLKSGSGLRHLALYPQGKLLYVISRLEGSVVSHGYDPVTGHVSKERQCISTTPADYTGQKSGAEILVYLSGRFLYVSNRKLKSDYPLADSVAAFGIDAPDELAPFQYWNEGVHFSRAMATASDGSHAYVFGQKGDTILRLRIDGQTGKLDQPTVVAEVPMLACLVFAAQALLAREKKPWVVRDRPAATQLQQPAPRGTIPRTNTPAPCDDLATPQPHSPEEAARARLRGLGSCMTEPRVRVLAVLMQGADALSHQVVCDALPDDSGINRATVYRVLDWLVAGGIVHKTARADHVFRFSLAEHDVAREIAHRSHSHFHCTQCGRDPCLGGAGPSAMPMATLPVGFAADHAELTIKGACADCAPLASHHKTGNAPCPK